MNLNPADMELLDALASTPFIDRLETVAITGWSRGAVYEGFGRLEDAGLAASVPHASDLIPPTRRYRITADGLRRLAESGDATPVSSTGQAVDELLGSRPVSAQWLRLVVERIDALAVVYRLASAVANVAHPVTLRLYRAMPLDAAMTLPGGKTLGVVRQGLTADRTAFSRRLWKLRDVPLPGVMLVLVTDEVRLRHARRTLSRSVNALLALERDAALASTGDRVWRPAASGPPLDLRYLIKRLAPGGVLPEEVPAANADMPGDDVPDTGPRAPRAAQSRREARPRPDLRLALDGARRACRPDGRLRAASVAAHHTPGGVRPCRKARRGERAHGPHRQGAVSPRPQGPHLRGLGQEAVERRPPGLRGPDGVAQRDGRQEQTAAQEH